MPEPAPDARWPKLLSLAVHEFRTPITVVAGYIRMLLRERAGPVSEQQRKLLEEAEKSCARLTALVSEMSDLSNIERDTSPIRRVPIELQTLLAEAIAGLPEMQDQTVTVVLQDNPAGTVNVDVARLRLALASVLTALRRELVTSDKLMVRSIANDGGPIRIAIGDEAQIDGIAAADPSTLAHFDEWRGGSGLSLAVARRIIGQHGGLLLSPPGDGRAGAVVTLPRE